MIFLIEYSRREGRIIRIEKFGDQDRERAANLRLDIELELNRTRIEHEVVLLEAASENGLRRTHRRYFENAGQISSTG